MPVSHTTLSVRLEGQSAARLSDGRRRGRGNFLFTATPTRGKTAYRYRAAANHGRPQVRLSDIRGRRVQRLFHLLWIGRLKDAIASKKDGRAEEASGRKRAPRRCADASAKPPGRANNACRLCSRFATIRPSL